MGYQQTVHAETEELAGILAADPNALPQVLTHIAVGLTSNSPSVRVLAIQVLSHLASQIKQSQLISAGNPLYYLICVPLYLIGIPAYLICIPLYLSCIPVYLICIP